MKRLGHALEKIDERIPGVDLPLMSVSQTRGVIRRSELTDTLQRAESLDEYKVCRKGDIVFNKMKIRSGAMGVAPEDGLVTYHYEVMRLRDGMDARYIVYVMKSPWFTNELIARERGISAGGEYGGIRTTEVPFKVLRTIDVRLPEVDEQQQIADYLDRETARIDTLVEEQQRLIEMLRGRRAAVITQAATRGLDNAPLVDSGNVYLGAVPAHWTISRFSREMDVNGGQVDPRDEPWADMVLVAPNHIESGTGRIIGRETAREQGADSGKYFANDGQIIYSKIRPALNKVTVATEDCLTSADMYAMSSRNGDDHRYLMYFMLARPFHAFATLASLRVKMPKVNRDELGEAPFLRPPLEEQRAIAAYLDEQTAKIDTLTEETERLVELGRERRAALITAVVTGQIDVREMA